jgi:hypothetical protein
MESPQGPRIKPPKGQIKKATGDTFFKRNTALVVVFSAIMLFCITGWLIVKRITSSISKRYNYTVEADTAKEDTTIAYELETVYKEHYNSFITSSKLNIKGVETAYKLTDTTNNLVLADTRSFYNRYALEGHKDNSSYSIDFSAKVMHRHTSTITSPDTAILKLNINPVWDIDINANLSNCDFDLSKFKLRSLTLNGGAGQYLVRLGQRLPSTNIIVSTSAAEVTIEIPKSAGCQIENDSGLSSAAFDGFNKKGKGKYETAGFNSAKNKIYMHFSGGVSDFRVTKY